MSVFCLVHGSTQNLSGFNLLVRELEVLGHEAICPDLPIDKPEASGAYYAEAVTNGAPARVRSTNCCGPLGKQVIFAAGCEAAACGTNGVSSGHDSADQQKRSATAAVSPRDALPGLDWKRSDPRPETGQAVSVS